MWGQSFPVSKPLISATGTEDEMVGHEKAAAQVLRLTPGFQLTLLLERFNGRVVHVVLHVAVVKHFVIGRQAAVP